MALSFRSAASTTARRYSGVIAAALMAATSAVAPSPVAARDTDNLPPQCLKAGNELAQLKCGTAYYRQKRLDAEARGAASENQSATYKKGSEAALATKSCYDSLLDEVSAAKKVAPLTPEQKAAFKTRAAGCEKS